MSLFRTVEFPCPSCDTPRSFELNHSVNADRRPELRTEILDRTFQRETCDSCGNAFRVEPEFTYIETGAQMWIAVWPRQHAREWQTLESTAQEAFDRSFDTAPALRGDLRPRIVFGWESLHEKLVIADANLDDVTVELAKVALIRELEHIHGAPDFEFRMLGAEDDDLIFGWLRTADESLIESVSVSRDLIGEIEAEEESWNELRQSFTAGMFVDMQRVMLQRG